MNEELRQHIEYLRIAELKPYARNPRTHSPTQVKRIAASMREFGFTNPVLVNGEGEVIAGHGRLLAAQRLGMGEVPAIRLEHLTPAQVRAYRLADNQLTLLGEWDEEILSGELVELQNDEFDLDLLGFSNKELDALLGGTAGDDGDVEDNDIPAAPEKAVTRTGDIWLLGKHRILCGSATNRDDYDRLLEGVRVAVCLTDPPYELGESTTKKHDYASFIDTSEALDVLIAGFIPIVTGTSGLCVITPGNGNERRYSMPTWTMAWFVPAGVGKGPWGFCCWQPILCYGKDPMLAKGLGCHPDAFVIMEAGFKSEHPCAKPVEVWSWLMKRVSERGESVLDPFLGSGTTLVVAEQLGRVCFGIEIEPRYVDIAVRRWEGVTGKQAVLEGDGRTFGEVAGERHDG